MVIILRIGNRSFYTVNPIRIYLYSFPLNIRLTVPHVSRSFNRASYIDSGPAFIRLHHHGNVLETQAKERRYR
jgi:hypothetical protein